MDNSKLKNLEGKIKALENQASEMNEKLKENTAVVKTMREEMAKNIDKL